MIRIDLHNYEQYALDYLDGTLDAEWRAVFEHFLATHPDIAADFTDLAQAQLLPDTQQYMPNKNQFLQLPWTDDSMPPREAYLLDFAEQNLTQFEHQQIADYLVQHPELAADIAYFNSIQLQPYPAEILPRKKALYKPEQSPFTLYIRYIAVAAVLLAFVLTPVLWQLQPVQNPTATLPNPNIQPTVPATTTPQTAPPASVMPSSPVTMTDAPRTINKLTTHKYNTANTQTSSPIQQLSNISSLHQTLRVAALDLPKNTVTNTKPSTKNDFQQNTQTIKNNTKIPTPALLPTLTPTTILTSNFLPNLATPSLPNTQSDSMQPNLAANNPLPSANIIASLASNLLPSWIAQEQENKPQYEVSIDISSNTAKNKIIHRLLSNKILQNENN